MFGVVAAKCMDSSVDLIKLEMEIPREPR